MAAKVPTMSSSGFVEDIAEKADRLMSYYFVSESSQSNLYRGQITSLPAQIQQHGHDEVNLVEAVRNELTTYLSRFFDGMDVNVRSDLPNKNDPNRINLTVNVIVVQDGKQYSLGRLVSVLNSKIVDIVDINNTKGA